jgi:hypothetical protein
MTRARDLASGLAGVRPFAMAAGETGQLAVAASSPAGGYYYLSVSITFPVGRFTSAPITTVSNRDGNLGFSQRANATTTTGFNAIISSQGSGSAVWLNWVAVQMTSGAGAG